MGQADSEAAGRGAASESKAGTKSLSSVIHLSSVSKSAPDPGLHPFCLFHLTDVPLTGGGVQSGTESDRMTVYIGYGAIQ